MVADDNPSGESCRGGHRGAPVEQRCRTPMERLPKKRSAAMSAHVLLSEHKQTSRGHRQIDAIDPNPKWVTQCTTLPKTEDSNAKH
jgi:hypothetical protein